MITLFNSIIKRGHQPREGALRRLMEALGLQVTPNVDEADDADEDEDEDGDESTEPEPEGAESSDETDDESISADEPRN